MVGVFVGHFVSLTFPLQYSRQSDCRAGRAVNRDISKPLGKTHKIPKKSNYRVNRDRDFQFQLIDKNVLSPLKESKLNESSSK
jgi:hypothetical protein